LADPAGRRKAAAPKELRLAPLGRPRKVRSASDNASTIAPEKIKRTVRVAAKRKRTREVLPVCDDLDSEETLPPQYPGGACEIADADGSIEIPLEPRGPPLQVLRASEIVTSQHTDKEVLAIRAWLKDRSGPEPTPGTAEYRVVDGILCHPRPDPRTSRMQNRLFIPLHLRARSMEMAHSDGHVGYEATIRILENSAHWPGIRRDTKKFVSECLVCKEKAAGTPTAQLGDAPIPPHPWHTVGIDLLQLAPTKRGHRYLCVLVDILSRYAVAVPLRDKSAQQVAAALKRHVLQLPLLGPPAILVSDNGLEFSNKTMENLLRHYGVRHVFTTPYNPKANGSTERLNRTLLSILRGALTPSQQWDDSIPHILEIYNNCPHSATGVSPFEAITGRPPRHPQLTPDLLQVLTSPAQVSLSEVTLPNTNARLRSRLGPRKVFNDVWSTAEKVWLDSLEHHFGEVREHHLTSRARRHAQTNSERTPRAFTQDDLVVLRDVHRAQGVEGKLRRPYVGPWVVTQVNKNNTLILADLEGNALSRAVPFDHVRLWKHSSAPTDSTSRGGGCSKSPIYT